MCENKQSQQYTLTYTPLNYCIALSHCQPFQTAVPTTLTQSEITCILVSVAITSQLKNYLKWSLCSI